MNQIELFAKFDNWLKANPERFTVQEKQKVIDNFRNFLFNNDKTITDETYDFLVTIGIYPARHEEFGKFIFSKYPPTKYKRVLDVGAGRVCKLSEYLVSKGYEVTAIDPNIRLLPNEAKKKKIKVAKGLFTCDSEKKKGTDITKYDLVVGLEPCDATEHILRQCIRYNKPSSVLLCATAHDAIDGTKFENMQAWYDYLNKLSPTTNISTLENGSTVICNALVRSNEERE